MSSSPRRPATFKLDDPHVVVLGPDAEATRPSRGTVQVRPEPEPAPPPVPLDLAVVAPRSGLPWGALFWIALTGLVLLGLGLGVSNLVQDLFNRSQGLGFVGVACAALLVVALVAIIGREIIGLSRLATIERLHARAAETLVTDDRPAAEAIVRDLVGIARSNPRLAHARATLQGHSRDIIDGADLLKLAERELMSPLDAEARRLVSQAAQRVSIVTAISPRALIDMLFVFAAALRLIRQLARLYGGRPGALGEGLLNGLLTARLGLATIDVTRPLPFTALPRPALSDLAGDLMRKRDEQEN
jgi:putative membrane protein